MLLRRLALVCLVLLLAGCKEDLYTGLSERDANEMVALLDRHGIAAERARQADRTYTLAVEKDLFPDAVSVLSAYGYPRREYQSLGDVFTGDNLISSPLEEKARLMFALSQELSRSISDIDGVLSARVHLVLPESSPYRLPNAPKTQASASVLIRHDRDFPMGPLVPKIKTMVANSVEGLTYETVSVVLFPVETLKPFQVPAAGAVQPLAAAPQADQPAPLAPAAEPMARTGDSGGDGIGSVAFVLAGVIGGLLVAVAVFFLLGDRKTRRPA
ncbi:MAG: type III secretion inner membrane ring lipoprotein SctJ [Alphaproteobacteria bacterium]|nr:type III secretion inner membrane ring lipoprotein SctJ [Alphaproteobacteria bacterium]MDX5368332.1 type III secretion inner membrane ring lipoprotein SctJ [Alphaproteobacteria bacterium]MDX5463127.1 type III secretion inner membrane ring lipoprotein SctJ [Alphaproteobacteria bacterium]